MDKDRVAAAWRLPDAMWERMEPLLPKLRRNRKGGRPWVPNRRIADGIFYVLRTGCWTGSNAGGGRTRGAGVARARGAGCRRRGMPI